MASISTDWKPSAKHVSEYEVIKLPRGDENSYSEFRVASYQKKQGQYNKSEQAKLDEAADELARMEAKIIASPLEVE